MAGVVLEVVALGFEGVVVLVFDLPAAAPGGGERQRCQVLWGCWIEQVADRLIAGEAVDPERRGGVVAPVLLLQALLLVEERRTLGEEHRQGAERGTLQPVALVIATLAKLCQVAVEKAAIQAEIEKVTDIHRFADFGVLMTPGLLIDGEIKSTGRLPAASEIDHWLNERRSD